MEITKVCNNYPSKAGEFSFCGLGAKGITLRYALTKQRHLLPPAMAEAISRLLEGGSTSHPTLRELHLQTYAPLLDCKTLDEARNLFPEFMGVLDAKAVLQRQRANIRKIEEHCPKERLSLLLLQELWGKLTPQAELAKQLGLSSHRQLDYFKSAICFPNRSTAYTNLLKASEPEMNSEMARKTTAYNLLHPDLMYARNKRAAQFTKTPEYREAQKQRLRQHFIDHPEKREFAKRVSQTVWDRLPHMKQALKDFLEKECSQYTRSVIKKLFTGEKFSSADARVRMQFYKDFWAKYPEFRQEYSQMRKAVVAELRKPKTEN